MFPELCLNSLFVLQEKQNVFFSFLRISVYDADGT